MTQQHLTQYKTSVASIEPIAPMIRKLTIKCPEGFIWHAGDYIWLGLDDHTMKPFSIANHSSTTQIECHIAMTDAMSVWLHDIEQAQDVWMRGPVQQYHWPEGKEDILLVAGGTGITPLINLVQKNISNQRTIVLYWGIKDLSFAYLQQDLASLAMKYSHFHYHLVLSEPTINWQGLTGLVPDVVAQQYPLSDTQHCLICGPWPMVNAVKAWAQNTLPTQQIQS